MTLAKQICEGLAFAHRNGVIHGDLRPSNILFTNTGRAKITDFGLDEHYVPPKGKVNWYNPLGEPKSVRADILAAGVIFFQMLTGSEPEWVDGTLSLPDSFDSFPIEMQAMLIKMFSTDRKYRYTSCDEVIKEIDNYRTAEIKSKARDTDATIIEEKGEPKETPSAEPVKPSVLRVLTTLFFLILLIFSVLVYLTYTGDIYRYLAVLTDFWKALVKWIMNPLS
jgi:serine/threonine-protein kinase